MSQNHRPALAVWPLLAVMSLSPMQLQTPNRSIASEETSADAAAKAAIALADAGVEKAADAKEEVIVVDAKEEEELKPAAEAKKEEATAVVEAKKEEEAKPAAEAKKEEATAVVEAKEEEKVVVAEVKKEEVAKPKEEAKKEESKLVVTEEEKIEALSEKKEVPCDTAKETKALTDRIVALESQTQEVMKYMLSTLQAMISMQQQMSFRNNYDSVYKYRVEAPESWYYAQNNQATPINLREHFLPTSSPQVNNQVQTLIAPNVSGLSMLEQGIPSSYTAQNGAWSLSSQFDFGAPRQAGWYDPQSFGLTSSSAPVYNPHIMNFTTI